MSPSKIIYYKDEASDDFAGNNIVTKQIPRHFRYVNNNILYRAVTFVVYHLIAKPIVWCIMKGLYFNTLKNRKVLKKVRGKAVFIYANHTSDLMDAFRPNTLRLFHKNYIIANPDAFSIRGIRTLVSMLGALPLVEDDLHHQAKLLKAIQARLDQKASVTVYPERHIWPFYTKIRPFPVAAMHYPVKFDVPVIVLTTTYQRRRGIFKWMKRPRAVQYLDGPFYPNPQLSKAEAKKTLHEQVYQAMCSRSEGSSQYEYIKYIKKP